MTRDGRIDGLKFFLILLVVFGHLPSFTSSDFCADVARWVYAFHMPLFVFLSGYFTSLSQDTAKHRRWQKHTLISFLVMQALLIAVHTCLDHFYWNYLTRPLLALWYLLSLLYWRSLYWWMGRKLSDTTLLVGSFVLLAIAAFVPVTTAFAFQRTFLFLPFFVSGVIVRRHHLLEQITRLPLWTAIILLGLSSWIAFLLPGLWAPMTLHSISELSVRLLQVANASVFCLAFLRLSRLKIFAAFAQFGQYTMWIYLGHIVVITFLQYFQKMYNITDCSGYINFILTPAIVAFLLVVRNLYYGLLQHTRWAKASTLVILMMIGGWAQSWAQNNIIYYTTNNDGILRPDNIEAFGARIVSNKYEEDRGCITFDADITKVGARAFHNCTRLTSITLPESIDSIGDNAFQGCKQLLKVNIPGRLVNIGDYAFINCRKLSLNLLSLQQLKYIGTYSFAGCTRITGNLSALKDVVRIGNYAFADCPEVTKDYEIPGQPADTARTTFRFLTWNIQGLAWGFNHQPEHVDSLVESKGVKQFIARYQPHIYVANEVPEYLSKQKSDATSGIKLVCGYDEDKVHYAFSGSGITNTIVTKDVIVDRESYRHNSIYWRHVRHFGVATQYIDGIKVAIVVVHLEGTPKTAAPDVQQQIDSIRYLQALDVVKTVSQYDHVIVAGDFNCNRQRYGEDLKGVATIFSEAGFEDVDFGKNWNIDHVFIKGFDALDRKIKNIDLKLSDHPLYWVDLRLK